MFKSPPTRWSAAAIHLLLSVLLIGTIALAAFTQWFPAGLHHAAKLDKLLGIMLAVDIVAGPLLTLILYRRGKRGLKLDLAVIALLQLGFLAYGLGTLWKSRPLFLVGSSQAFALLFANEVPDDAASTARAAGWRRFHGSGPWLVGVDLSSPVAREEFLFSYLGGSPGPLADADLFRPYGDVSADIASKARVLASDVPAPAAERDSLRSMPLMSTRSKTTVMLVDAQTGAPVRAVALLPATEVPPSVRK
jgi:hypothetical protein